MNKLKEKILVVRVRNGDGEAFREVYKILSDRIYRFVFYRLPNADEAQDILQETFVRLWNYLINKNKDISSLQGLTYKIAKNLLADYYTKNKIEEIDIKGVDYKIGEDSDVSSKMDIRISIKNVREKINKLDRDEYREVIELKFLDELSHKEIAEILDKTEPAVRTLLYRALKKLKKVISNEK